MFFHISLLKPHKGEMPSTISHLPPNSLDKKHVVKPLAILDKQTVLDDSTQKQQVLVEWNSLRPEDATLENVEDHGDKVLLEWDGDDTDSTID